MQPTKSSKRSTSQSPGFRTLILATNKKLKTYISKPWLSNSHSCNHPKRSKRTSQSPRSRTLTLATNETLKTYISKPEDPSRPLQAMSEDPSRPFKNSSRTDRGPFEERSRTDRGPLQAPPFQTLQEQFENRSRTVRDVRGDRGPLQAPPFQTLQEQFENRWRTISKTNPSSPFQTLREPFRNVGERPEDRSRTLRPLEDGSRTLPVPSRPFENRSGMLENGPRTVLQHSLNGKGLEGSSNGPRTVFEGASNGSRTVLEGSGRVLEGSSNGPRPVLQNSLNGKGVWKGPHSVLGGASKGPRALRCTF